MTVYKHVAARGTVGVRGPPGSGIQKSPPVEDGGHRCGGIRRLHQGLYLLNFHRAWHRIKNQTHRKREGIVPVGRQSCGHQWMAVARVPTLEFSIALDGTFTGCRGYAALRSGAVKPGVAGVHGQPGDVDIRGSVGHVIDRPFGGRIIYT